MTYTTIQNVKDRLSQVSGSNVTDEMISGSIVQAEGVIDAGMRLSGRSGGNYSYSGANHGLITNTATAMAAYITLGYLVEEFLSTSSAALTADLLWAEINRNMGILVDGRVRKWIQEV